MRTSRHRIASAVLAGMAAVIVAFWACLFGPQVTQAQDAAQTTQPKKNAGDEKIIRALIAELGDDSFEKREAAQKHLAGIGAPALDFLRQAAKDSPDLEVRERASHLVDAMRDMLFRSMLKNKQWGNSVDPDGDCKFCVDAGNLHIKIPGKPHRLGIEFGATNAPRVLRLIEGDFSAEMKVSDVLTADARKAVGKYPWWGAGFLVWQDEKNYIRLERAHQHFSPDQRFCYTSWELRRDGKHARKGVNEDGPLDELKPAFFRLFRKGNIFSASYSQDGKQWHELPPIQADFAKKLGVGVAAVHNTVSGYEGVFESLKITALNK